MKSRLDELTFGKFNVCPAAVNGVNGTEHIDTLLRPYAAKDCELIGLQENKRDELPNSWHLDTASFSAVIAAVSKAEKGNVGLDW